MTEKLEKKTPQSRLLLAERGDVESSKASFDRASKNTISTLTMLHLFNVNAV